MYDLDLIVKKKTVSQISEFSELFSYCRSSAGLLEQAEAGRNSEAHQVDMEGVGLDLWCGLSGCETWNWYLWLFIYLVYRREWLERIGGEIRICWTCLYNCINIWTQLVVSAVVRIGVFLK